LSGRLPFALGINGIDTRTPEPPGFSGRFTGLGQRHIPDWTEAHFANLAVGLVPIEPALRATIGDAQD
jgi:hypothetical protein